MDDGDGGDADAIAGESADRDATADEAADGEERAEAGIEGLVADASDSLRERWTVQAVQRGVPRRPPQMGGDRRVGLTDRRLLWREGEDVRSVALAAVEGLELDVHRHRGAPRIVRIGSGVLVTGLLATLVATLLSLVPLPAALLPVILGSAAFAATLAYARLTGAAGTERVAHRLRIDEGGSPVALWGEESTLADLADAIRSAREESDGPEEAGGEERP